MRTTKLISHLSRTVVALIIIITVFILSSCNKDELYPASPPASSSTDVAVGQDQAAVNPMNLPYRVITINHLSARTSLPDYEVAVYSDRNVIFEGRRNTTFTGTKNFKIDERTFFTLKDMFISSHLFDGLIGPGSVPPTEMADVPEVFTSFNDGTHPTVTLRDYNNLYAMRELIRLRTDAEALLNIESLVGNNSDVFAH